jgi:hypothetical protein
VCAAKFGLKINSTLVVSLASADRKSDVREQNSHTSASVGRVFVIACMELDLCFFTSPTPAMTGVRPYTPDESLLT